MTLCFKKPEGPTPETAVREQGGYFKSSKPPLGRDSGSSPPQWGALKRCVRSLPGRVWPLWLPAQLGLGLAVRSVLLVAVFTPALLV